MTLAKHWWDNPPITLDQKLLVLRDRAKHAKAHSKEGQEYRALYTQVKQHWKALEGEAFKKEPLRFTRVSYEQSLVLNSWLYGITFPMLFTANRIGKTAVCILNFLMWIFPNDPSWRIFKRYTDHLGRIVEVFPRPSILKIRRIQKYLEEHPELKPDPRLPHEHKQNQPILQRLQDDLPQDTFEPSFPESPWPTQGKIWWCAQDNNKLKEDFFPEWLHWLPSSSVKKYVEHNFTLTFKAAGRLWKVIGKSFEADPEKFASGAVDMIGITEGLTSGHLKEIKLRFKHPAVGSWDYTPHEAVNVGSKSKLAQDVKAGKEKMPLRKFVFMKFTLYDAPTFIVPEEKRKDLIESFEGTPEGQARLNGEFYSSSALVLGNLNRSIHLLPWTVEEMFARYPNGQIVRGFDAGLDHPTTCTWALLIPGNIYIVYRIFSERGLTIKERCKRVIALSNNERLYVPFKTGKGGRWIETHPNKNSEVPLITYADYHIFKEDENTGRPYSLNYILQGLQIVESIHTGPEQRAQLFDDMLEPSEFKAHLLTKEPPGPQVYFLQKGYGILPALDIWEEFYWQRYAQGERKGTPKDKVPVINDDELDSTCYVTLSPLRWTTRRPRAILISGSEERATEPEGSLQRLQEAHSSAGRFGDPSHADEDTDERLY